MSAADYTDRMPAPLLSPVAGLDPAWPEYADSVRAALLGGADILARTVVIPAELPIGLVTALVGGPFFLWLLLRRRAGAV